MSRGLRALKRLKVVIEVNAKHWKQDVGYIEEELKALETVKGLFGFDFAIRFGDNQRMLMITNKRTNEYWEMPLTQEKYDLLKEVFE